MPHNVEKTHEAGCEKFNASAAKCHSSKRTLLKLRARCLKGAPALRSTATSHEH
jgi:hypothetical protein